MPPRGTMRPMPAIPESTRRSILLRLLDHTEHNWPQLAKVQARYHGSLAYITGVLPSGEADPAIPAPLRRLRPLLRLRDLLTRPRPLRRRRPAHRTPHRQPARSPRHRLHFSPRSARVPTRILAPDGLSCDNHVLKIKSRGSAAPPSVVDVRRVGQPMLGVNSAEVALVISDAKLWDLLAGDPV
jgi:hypothetical protein